MADLERNSQGLGDRPALVLVDMINGFTDPACSLGAECESVVKANATLLAACRSKGLPVFFTTVVYTNDDQATVFRGRINALNQLTPDSHWVKVDDRLAMQDGETLVKKHWASSFFKTDLADQIRSAGGDSIIVTGLTTSGCVRATVVDGLQHDFPVVVPREAVGDRNKAAHDANLHDMHAKYADVMELDQVLADINAL